MIFVKPIFKGRPIQSQHNRIGDIILDEQIVEHRAVVDVALVHPEIHTGGVVHHHVGVLLDIGLVDIGVHGLHQPDLQHQKEADDGSDNCFAILLLVDRHVALLYRLIFGPTLLPPISTRVFR